jgi:hypothetical protein
MWAGEKSRISEWVHTQTSTLPVRSISNGADLPKTLVCQVMGCRHLTFAKAAAPEFQNLVSKFKTPECRRSRDIWTQLALAFSIGRLSVAV